MSRPVRDLSGWLFGGLTVLWEAQPKSNHRYWYCQCACGKKLAVAQSNLTSGRVKSCGCEKTALSRMGRPR